MKYRMELHSDDLTFLKFVEAYVSQGRSLEDNGAYSKFYENESGLELE